MSLQKVNEILFSGEDGVTAAVFAEYTVKLMVKRKDGRHITQEVPFGIGSDDASASLADLDQAASVMAARIAKLSEGVVVGLYKKLGKYRNDEVPEIIDCNNKQYGMLIMSNNPLVEDPDFSGTLPRNQKSMKLFVPWLNDTTSRQDMKATLKNPVTVNGVEYYAGTSRFADELKTEVEVFLTKYVQGVVTKCYNKVATQGYLPNDTDEGIGTDGIISEGMTSVVAGQDDQESM